MPTAWTRPLPCLALALTLAVTGVSATAQADTFDARLDAALASAGTRAPLISCIALFRSFRLFLGPETEAGIVAANRETDMAVIATIIWQEETNTDMDSAMDAILPLSDAATELYIDRFNANRAATGSVFDDDLTDRLGLCNAFRTNLLDALE